MTTHVAADEWALGAARHQVRDDDSRDPALLAATLVAALEQTLLTAHRLLDALAVTAGHRPAAERPVAAGTPVMTGAGGLSRREAEVLALLAAGSSNPAIARALCLSPRTVQRHVANLYLKIGVHNRAAATTFAIHHGLRQQQ